MVKISKAAKRDFRYHIVGKMPQVLTVGAERLQQASELETMAGSKYPLDAPASVAF